MSSNEKHLEFIQNIITRMNTNSFQIKGWAVTIVYALLAIYASSKNEYFILAAKITIAYKEVHKTHYWIRLLCDSDNIDTEASLSILQDCDDLLIHLGSIQIIVRPQIHNS